MAPARSHVCSWGYVILVSKSLLLMLDSGIAKSFGVLIPMMVQRLDSDYATVGLICSMPATFIYLFFPLVTLTLQKFSYHSVAMAGGVLSGSCILACAFITNTASMGVCLALSGAGFSMALVPSTMAINDYFPENFVFLNTITLYGYTAGSMFLPIITENAVQAYGYTGAFVILAGISFNIVVCGATFRKAPRRVVTNAQGRNQLGENDQECLIRGEALHQHTEMVNQMESESGNRMTRDIERIVKQRDSYEGNAKEQSISISPQRENRHGRDIMVKRGRAIEDRQPHLSQGFDPERENDHDETEDNNTKVGQRYLTQNGTQETDIPCDFPDETSPAKSSVPSFIQTCTRSCGILNEPLFLFSLPTQVLVNYAAYAWMLFLVPHAEHLGITASRAVFLSFIGGVGGIIGRTIFIILVGKGVNPFMVYIPVCIICTASFLLDFISSAYEVRAVLAFLQGFCFFIEDTILTTIPKTMIFDDKNFGMAYTIGGFCTGVGATCSGLFTGYLFDVTQSFTKIFIIIGFIHAVTVVNLIMMILLKKRK